MIELRRVSGRAKNAVLEGVDFTVAKGIFAILGTPADGTSLLLATIAGLARPRTGSVRVHGETPDRMRARIAYVGFDIAFPAMLTVAEVCAVSAELRGDPRATAADRLGALAPLAPRRIGTLDASEVRGVALAVALSSRADVILVDEPFVEMAGDASALRARAKDATVLFATASVRDAMTLADERARLRRGVLAIVDRPSVSAAVMRLVVPAASTASLVGRLAADAMVTTRSTSAGTEIVVTSADRAKLAGLVRDAIAETNADVRLLEGSFLPLDRLPSTSPEEALP